MESREDGVRILTIVCLVTDPCLVVIKNTEAFTAKVTTVAIAVASVCISIVLWNVNMEATAEIAHTALR